jgi:hypothetical protein
MLNQRNLRHSINNVVSVQQSIFEEASDTVSLILLPMDVQLVALGATIHFARLGIRDLMEAEQEKALLDERRAGDPVRQCAAISIAS